MKAAESKGPQSFAAVAEVERLRNAKARETLKLSSSGDWGLALSGGGVRSATFCLGILQWLIRNKRISDFDFLSTVSGGGYIGGWLIALIHRFGSLEHLGTWRLDAAVAYLRRYSNYLTPHVGLLSLDTLSGVSIYLRNLLLNAFMLIAVLSAALYAPMLLSALLAALVKIQSHVAASVSALLFLWAAYWVGFAGPSCTPRESRVQRERFAGPAIAAPLLFSFLLQAHGMVAFRIKAESMTSTNSTMTSFLQFVTAGAMSYSLLAIVAYLAWNKARFGTFRVSPEARAEQLKRELSDSPAVLSYRTYIQHGLLTVLAGSLGGVLLWVIYQYLAGLLVGSLQSGETASAASFSGFLANLSAQGHTESHIIVALLVTPALFAAGFCTLAIHVALCRRLLTEHDREWSARWIATVGRWILIWWVGGFLAVVTPSVLRMLGGIGWGSVLSWLGASGLSARFANSIDKQGGTTKTAVRKAIVSVGPYVFVVGALIFVAAFNFDVIAAVGGGRPAVIDVQSFSWPGSVLRQLGEDVVVWRADISYLLLLFGVPIVLAFVAGFAVDVNLFSFQSYYRNRLARCYLGASRFVQIPDAQRAECSRWLGTGGRTPHSPTDLDPEDDMRLADLVDVRPYPIINTALNLNSSSESAWQYRKAASFVFTPMFCGFQVPLNFDAVATADLFCANPDGTHVAGGYRPTRTYLYAKNDGPKLGLPIAVSGAAFTSNAGCRTTPWMTFLLTVFGVRLGRWCGNPGVPHWWLRASPRNSLGLLVDELLGRTSESRPFVYLSDGGHFENLGIYELVRRHCVHILAIDASADPNYEFDDLANAIHKCRVDFGVEISFPAGSLNKLQRTTATAISSASAAVGSLCYPDGTKGTLIYLKPALTGGEPADIAYYHSQHPIFPHETTLNQWFSESQFESYRRLGEHVAEQELSKLLSMRT